ncbi:putative Fe-S-cluster oxidoreductase [Thermoplasmatales archaeon BRNA1]|nr:putative Fe-S-cluster oxidoreductase [Thermoplasmatales archaeon BRNA1]
MADYIVDYSEVSGRKAECIDGCGMCCLCQPEILPEERPFFKKNHPDCIEKSRGPEHYTAIKLKNDRGSCVFLNECRRCKVYDHRTAYCRQFPYHIYVSDHVKVELDLSCRGVWTGKGADAMAEAKALVANADARIREALPQARDIYSQFYSFAREAGVMADTSMLRMTVSESLAHFTEPEFLYRLLDASQVLPQMTIADGLKQTKVDYKELEDAARETALESLSSEDPLNLPVYSARDLSWNVFSADDGKIEWMVVGDDGEFHHKGSVDAKDIKLPQLNNEGRNVLKDYIATLNGRDSFLGSVFYLIDANGYEDDMSNAYYGTLATAALDILWRASLLDHFFHTGFGAEGMRDAIIFYDMDRLDAPAIGAFI